MTMKCKRLGIMSSDVNVCECMRLPQIVISSCNTICPPPPSLPRSVCTSVPWEHLACCGRAGWVLWGTLRYTAHPNPTYSPHPYTCNVVCGGALHCIGVVLWCTVRLYCHTCYLLNKNSQLQKIYIQNVYIKYDKTTKRRPSTELVSLVVVAVRFLGPRIMVGSKEIHVTALRN